MYRYSGEKIYLKGRFAKTVFYVVYFRHEMFITGCFAPPFYNKVTIGPGAGDAAESLA